MRRRIGETRGGKPNRGAAPVKLEDLIRDEAKERQSSLTAMQTNAQIHRMFFLNSSEPYSGIGDPAVLADKSIYIEALRSPDPHLGLETLISLKLAAPHFTVKDARDTVKKLAADASGGGKTPDVGSFANSAEPSTISESGATPLSESAQGSAGEPEIIEGKFIDGDESPAPFAGIQHAAGDNWAIYTGPVDASPGNYLPMFEAIPGDHSVDLVVCDTSLLDLRFHEYETLGRAVRGCLRTGGSCVVLVSPGRVRMASDAFC